MSCAPRDPRHRRVITEFSPELRRRLYEIGRPLNLSIVDVLVAAGRGLRAQREAANSEPADRPDRPDRPAT